MDVAEKTVTPVQQLYDWPVCEFFFYASYIIEANNKKIADLKKMRLRP